MLIANNRVTGTRPGPIRGSASAINRSSPTMVRATVTHAVESKPVAKQKKQMHGYLSDMTTYQKQ